MDLRSMLNSDSSSSSSRQPPNPYPPHHFRPVPPPLQPPHSLYHAPPGGGAYGHAQPHHSPYHSSPSSSQYPFPPPPSPHSQQQQQQQQQSYAHSPVGTPHPLSAHSTIHSAPSSAASSLHGQFPLPPIQPHHYAPPLSQPQPQHPLHPPPSPHAQYHSPHQQSPHQLQQQGYPRQSPITSPIDGRPLLIHTGSADSNGSEKPAPMACALISNEWDRERATPLGLERDISISPKTRLPMYLPEDESLPDAKEEYYPGGRPNPQHPQHHHHHLPLQVVDGSGNYSRRSSSAVTPVHDRRSIETVDMDGGSGPGAERNWGSPVADRSRPNGTSAGDSRDGGQLAPPKPQQSPLNSLSQQHNQTSATGQNSSRRMSTAPPNTKEPSLPPPPPQVQRSTPTPTLNARLPPPPPSPKTHSQSQQLGPPPTPTQQQSQGEGNSASPNSGGPPRKRPRRDEAPIWARKASRSSSSSPVMSNRKAPGPAPGPSAGGQQQQQQQQQHQPIQPQHQPQPQQQQQEPQQQQPQQSGPPVGPANQQQQQHQPPPLQKQPRDQQTRDLQRPPIHTRIVPELGPWEPSFLNHEPNEELTNAIAHFLFTHVVNQNDPALIAVGGDGPVATIEIEAKLGHLIDMTTNERLRLPVVTETVMEDTQNNRNSQWKIKFRSSMTETQHKQLNQFLNKSFADSLKKQAPPTSPSSSETPDQPLARIPMEYVHTRERDSFYDLPQSAHPTLPDTLRRHLSKRWPTRVRVTTDQKTGKVINKIVKARIADLNVYSPRTAFDWRVSVNVEMPYLGDIESLSRANSSTGADGDRNKDRLSYSHLAYQIDLTQVTDKSSNKEHELEVEVSGKEIRKHGLLARENKTNAYEVLVRGFVDNVRTLIREIREW